MKTLVILFTFLSFSLQAQFKQSVDYVCGLEYSYRVLKTQSSAVDWIKDIRNVNEKGKANWRFGTNYNIRLSNRIYLKSGLRIASSGYQINRNNLRHDLKYPNQHDGKGGWDPTIGGEASNINKKYNYIFTEIPVVGRYVFGSKKWTYFAELGVSPSLYISSFTSVKKDNTNDIELERHSRLEFNNFHFVGFASVGTQYNINENLQFFLQPTARFHLTSLANTPIQSYLYNVGLECGLRRRI